MNKTLEEWIEFYERKTGKKFKPEENYKLLYRPDKGFCEISASDNAILVGAVSGDGKFWKSSADLLARYMKFNFCRSINIRKNIRAYLRLFGYRITKITEENGLKYIESKNKDNKICGAFECIFEDGSHGYFLNWQV